MGHPHPPSQQKIVLTLYCSLFRHLGQNITQKYLLLLYHSLLYPNLIYGILTWGSTNNSVLHPPTSLTK